MTWDRESLRALRAAVAQGDPAALGAAVHGRDLDAVLQLAGEGLLATPDVALARECAAGLRRRGLAGDAELADALERRPTELRALAVDVEELASITEGDPVRGGGRIDLRTGEIWHHSPYDDPEDDDALDHEDRWLWVSADSHDGWRDMAEFAGTVTDAALAGRLERALHGRRVFRRFRDALDEHPEELTRFHLFAEERQRGRARRWLADHGLRPAVPSSSGDA
jgi:Uncharacterised protein family (UPF0158)